MTVETATYISDLNSSLPAASDGRVEGDDHIRLLKATIKATLPNVAGAVTPTHTVLNNIGLVLLATGDASNSSVIILTGPSSTYDEYEVHWQNVVPQTAAGYLLHNFNGSGSGHYYYSFQTQASGGTTMAGSNAASQDSFALNLSAISATASHGGCSGVLRIFAANSSANKQTTFTNVCATGATAQDSVFGGQGLWAQTTAITDVRLFMQKTSDNSAQNIASGTFRLYGVKK